MRELRLALAGTVMVTAMAVVATPVYGRTGSDAYTAGAIDCAIRDGTEQTDESVELLGFRLRCKVEMSDPRVSGIWEADAAEACFMEADDIACVVWGATELAGPDGTWVGSWSSAFEAESDALPASMVLAGTGAYEGWTFASVVPDFMVAEPTVYGVIYEGPPPPWGETLPLVPVE